MPSSLIIVALAVAWLVVLVPMVARKRQVVAQTAGDEAMASRVLSRPEPQVDEREESAMAETDTDRAEEAEVAAEEVETTYDEEVTEPAAEEHGEEVPERARSYRPGRGGFDPEAAEVAAKAKYTFRQRVVLALIATVVITALGAVVLWSGLWWAAGAAGLGLVGYLAYLRRQVGIENEIRKRRMARMGRAGSADRRHRDEELDADFDDEAGYADSYEIADGGPTPIAGVERARRAPQRRNASVVDLDDEDPEFYELSEPGPPVYRRAAGE